MSSLPRYAGAIFATARRDARIFFTYRLRFVSQALGSLFTLTVFFYVAKLARHDAIGHHASYYSFLVVGILATVVLQSALGLATLVRMELVAGNFERMLVAPFGPVAGVLSMALFPVLYSIVTAGTTFALAAALFGVSVHVSAIPLVLGVALLAGAAFVAIAILFVAALVAFKSSAGVTWAMAGLSLVGGVYFPIALFPGWVRWMSDAQPLTPALDLLRHLLVASPSPQPVALELARLAGFAVVLLPVSCALLRQAVQFSRRRGTIMEY
jgi:ABC-2 type transport system permease protein